MSVDEEPIFFGVVDDDEAQEQQRAYEEKRRLKQQRIATGIDTRIESDAVDPPVEGNDATGGEIPLEVYETKWGFSLAELQAASKVVTVLFNNPSLFVGDPHLADSRLYTMISRDRKTKRENKDVYRQVMNEEKSRRERVLRQQDLETIKKTTMKRERDDALQALLLPPPPSEGSEATAPLLLTDAPSSPPPTSVSVAVSHAVSERFCVLGALEALVHLQAALWMIAQCSANTSDDDEKKDVVHHAPKDATDGLSTAPTGTMSPAEAYQRQVAHWTAVVYRFLPHPFGSQMPPPIVLSVPDAVPSSGCTDSPPTHDDSPSASSALYGLTFRTVRSVVVQLMDVVLRNRWVSTESVVLPRSEEVAEGFGRLFTSIHELYERAEEAFGDGSSSDGVDEAMDVSTVRQWLLSPRETSANASIPLGWERWVAGSKAKVNDDSSEVDIVCQTMMAWVLHAVLVCAPPTSSATSGSEDAAVLRAKVKEAISSLRYGRSNRISEGSASVIFSRKGTTPLGYFCSFMLAAVEPPTADDEPLVSAAPAEVHECICGSLRYCHTVVPHTDELTMNRVQKCHTCKRKYQTLHPYYYSLCGMCGEYNYQKRMMTRDLRGKVVLLTGCRIKIGYAMAVSLLRCGAVLLGTTRFSHDAIARFMEEADYPVWKDRLHLFSLDLRDMWMVTQFCGFLTQKFPKLFAIINNAAQTIARTPEYTAALRSMEVQPPPMLRSSLEKDAKGDEWYHFFERNSSVTIGMPLQMEHRPEEHPSPFLLDAAAAATASHPHPSETTDLSTHPIGNAAGAVVAAIVQPHQARYDTQAEAMDLRTTNSWTMNLHEVQGSEAAEVMAINALSPFVLNSRLKPLLLNRSGDEHPNEGRFIVNVSAMEGQFYRFKQTTHPHTNMAKAALNMMTRTSAEDYAQSGIYMNSVDTGWITDESPVQKKQRRADDFMLCPLDEVDAAARCLDLIYMDSREYGKFW
eukprot:CAMPEP_0176419984 /NCGR_PEP_ID=MMETSP0127-20121128/8356_1 /TAXON_ID=938130 /ORGANISM="Platyophrya macrostoma, Strain WH" /LENGTH=969 /DNA_ID=CAMNT_0017800533 /DNA_START=89 /DNA_END=2995 /DNA_ORIENTATION=+